jgi:hypothetical protein
MFGIADVRRSKGAEKHREDSPAQATDGGLVLLGGGNGRRSAAFKHRLRLLLAWLRSA